MRSLGAPLPTQQSLTMRVQVVFLLFFVGIVNESERSCKILSRYFAFKIILSLKTLEIKKKIYYVICQTRNLRHQRGDNKLQTRIEEINTYYWQINEFLRIYSTMRFIALSPSPNKANRQLMVARLSMILILILLLIIIYILFIG